MSAKSKGKVSTSRAKSTRIASMNRRNGSAKRMANNSISNQVAHANIKKTYSKVKGNNNDKSGNNSSRPHKVNTNYDYDKMEYVPDLSDHYSSSSSDDDDDESSSSISVVSVAQYVSPFSKDLTPAAAGRAASYEPPPLPETFNTLGYNVVARATYKLPPPSPVEPTANKSPEPLAPEENVVANNFVHEEETRVPGNLRERIFVRYEPRKPLVINMARCGKGKRKKRGKYSNKNRTGEKYLIRCDDIFEEDDLPFGDYYARQSWPHPRPSKDSHAYNRYGHQVYFVKSS